jgi:hypothetical protein
LTDELDGHDTEVCDAPTIVNRAQGDRLEISRRVRGVLVLPTAATAK